MNRIVMMVLKNLHVVPGAFAKLRKEAENKSDTPQAITITIEGGESAWQE